jgi:hypothetical protein
MECIVFTYAFNHQNRLTKCFIAADEFVLIPVTKFVGGNVNVTKRERHEEKCRKKLLEANMEHGLEIQALKMCFCFVIKNAIQNNFIMTSSLTCGKAANFKQV